LSGAADKLTQTGQALQWNFLLAVVITYLLMASLYESFLYPFVIMFTVPLAAVGGFLGLAVLNRFTFQALDVLTMLGFFILVGTVVDNAILIVHQCLNHIRNEGMEPHEAIKESAANRIRPIFMTVSTSVVGMLPLVIVPGAGSELYRGLGSVIVGGLVVSTLFTLLLIPALLSLTFDIRAALVSRFHALLHPARSSGDD
jgi:HAE1 family hydrophobic/amphiphilic exporter-1